MMILKKFKKVEDMVRWLNKPENDDVKPFTALPAQGEYALVYHETPKQAIEQRRLTILGERIRAHVEYPAETKRKLGYPETLIDFEVAPFSRIHNSIRNLKAFKDLTPAQLTTFLHDNLASLGWKHLNRVESMEEYGVSVALVERDTDAELQ